MHQIVHFFGVFYTILNLSNDIYKSYYQNFSNSECITPCLIKIVKDITWKRLGINANHIADICNDGDVAYLILSRTYSHVPVVIVLKDNSLPYVIAFTDKKEIIEPVNIGSIIDPSITGKEIIKYVDKPRQSQYIGMRIKLGFITLEQAINSPDYICKYNNWLVYNYNDKYYIVVDSNPKNFIFPSSDKSLNLYWESIKYKNKPIFYLIDKSNMSSDLKTDDFKNVVQSIKDIKGIKDTEKNPKKVNSFWNFIKKRP